jgi:hypothetical protein
MLLAAAVAGENARLAMLVMAARLLARTGFTGGDTGFGADALAARRATLPGERVTATECQQSANGRAPAGTTRGRLTDELREPIERDVLHPFPTPSSYWLSRAVMTANHTQKT